MASKMPVLHIHGQDHNHCEAFIVGSAEALAMLRSAIDKALLDGGGATLVFVNDGEGYHVGVAKVKDESVDRLARPYIDQRMTGANPDDAIWPHQIGQLCRALKAAEDEMVAKHGGPPTGEFANTTEL